VCGVNGMLFHATKFPSVKELGHVPTFAHHMSFV